MNKTSIKVIKRKNAAVEASAKTQTPHEPKPVSAFGARKIERRLHRKMADTVSNWIAERAQNNRMKEISAIRNLFGDESLLSKLA